MIGLIFSQIASLYTSAFFLSAVWDIKVFEMEGISQPAKDDMPLESKNYFGLQMPGFRLQI